MEVAETKDALLASTDVQDALFNVYAAAIAAGAGYSTWKQDFDRDGVDIQFRAGGHMMPSLDAQLKATINLGAPNKDGVFRYPLKRRNYDLLIAPSVVPRILVVYDMPEKPEEWMVAGDTEMILRRCAYWASLRGLPETKNEDSVTVSVPFGNRFDVNGLKGLMAKARSGVVDAS